MTEFLSQLAFEALKQKEMLTVSFLIFAGLVWVMNNKFENQEGQLDLKIRWGKKPPTKRK